MEPVRLVVIGAGTMGCRHANLIAAHDSCSLVGMSDIDASRSAVAREHDVPFYGDVTEMLDKERPDGAIISTPNDQHVSVAEACAKRSVHMLIEKPIADGIEAADRIVQLADETGISVLIGHHRRHGSFIKKARSIVSSGALGKLVAVSMLWALLKPKEYFEVEWRRTRPGGGPTLINLVHELDCLRFICGEIVQVFAKSSSATRNLDVEDSLAISLSFQHGAVGSILASDATPSPWSYEATTQENPDYFKTEENCYHFLGTMGSLAFPRMELWSYADKDRSGWQHPMGMSRTEMVKTDPLVSQLDHFCRVVRLEEEPIADAWDGTRSLSVALAVLESIQRQVPVVLPAS